jgi:hypothetical protein
MGSRLGLSIVSTIAFETGILAPFRSVSDGIKPDQLSRTAERTISADVIRLIREDLVKGE